MVIYSNVFERGGGNAYLSDIKFNILSRASGSPRDEESRLADILRGKI